MARWEYHEAKREPLSKMFRSFFYAGLFGNFIGLIAAISVKYFDDEVTAAKWKGVLSGLAFSVTGFAWAIIATSAIKIPALVAITFLILVSGIIFGACFNYKKGQ